MNLVSTGKYVPDQPGPISSSGRSATISRSDRPASGPSRTVATAPVTSLHSHVSAMLHSGSPAFPRCRAMAWPPKTSGLARAVSRSGYRPGRRPLTGSAVRR